ncbi:enoyl-CoA hydratase/isomerase family protein [Halanaerobium praevalens]|uniref:Enoyl-CoA hydratase/isomerase n=1 Tax=Halanaerobium praevalens (strain ATCC 33744 / DSM 2228 / GSL) TaxID=572479 RepID=E3DRH5_HALPG|nr:enoyl-CoA hydratase-related protein [Halanaerobium praevalens]ADO78107.1 Enoyl-CoA hydratase/isomerase [Halanaerobium praevalens DSM 2228]
MAKMAGELVKSDFKAPITTVKLNRPQVLNAYNADLLTQLEATLKQISDSDQIAAVILTSVGNKAFSVGGDIDYLENLSSKEAQALSKRGQKLCELIESMPQVVIAAVDGYALGGGMEITLACDLRLASTRSRFGQPEVKLGMIPAFGGTQRLPRLIGEGEAKELLYTGEIIDSTLAYNLGLINKVVTPRSLLAEAEELALKITERSTKAVEYIKKAINQKHSQNNQSALEYESQAFAECFKTKDHRLRIREIQKIIKADS